MNLLISQLRLRNIDVYYTSELDLKNVGKPLLCEVKGPRG